MQPDELIAASATLMETHLLTVPTVVRVRYKVAYDLSGFSDSELCFKKW